MHKILVLGPQGSGKGTQARILGEKLGIPALSMGQLLRDEIATGSELGKEISEIISKKAELVSDEIALEILKKRLSQPDVQRGYILDGYPRNEAQYNTFKDFDTPSALLLIMIPYDESMRRLLKRAELESRPDDTEELIAHRLQIYHQETRPIIERYNEQGIIKVIDGVGAVEEVAGRIDNVMNLK